MKHLDILMQGDTGCIRFAYWPKVLGILFAGCTGTYITMAACTMATKYIVVFILALACAGVLILLHHHVVKLSFFALIMTTGIGALYRLTTQYDLFYDGFSHMGGTCAEPIVYLVDLPIILIICIAFNQVFNQKKALPAWTMLDTFVFLFLTASVISFLNAKDLSYAIFEIARYVKYTMLYVALRILLEEENLGPILVGASAGIVGLEGIIAIAQYYFGFSVPFSVVGGAGGVTDAITEGVYFTRVTGMIGACNTFATWLLFPICISLSGLFMNFKPMQKILIFSSLILGFLSLVLTYSRTGMIACVVCCAGFLGIMAMRKRLLLKHCIVLICAMSLLGSLAAILGIGPYLSARFTSGFDEAYDARPEFNKIGMQMIKEHPFTGVGLNNFQIASGHYDPTGLTSRFDHVPHNMYMLFASETGIFGMFFYIGIGILLIRKSITLTKNDSKDFSFLIGASCTSYILGIMINGFGDWTLRNEMLIAQCAIMAALVMSAKPGVFILNMNSKLETA